MKEITWQYLKDKSDTVLLDTRSADLFVSGFIKGSIALPFDEYFGEGIKTFISPQQNLAIVAQEGLRSQIADQLQEAGYNNLIGFLPAAFGQWQAEKVPVDMVIDVDPYEFAIDLPNDDNLVALDVRTTAEFAQQHVDGSQNIALQLFADLAQVANLPERANIYVFCNNGSRSATACSILRKHGFINLRWVAGGFDEMKLQEGVPVTGMQKNLN